MPRAWTLAARPAGVPQPSDFALVALPDAPLAPGEIRVANRWLSVDPYMRGRMNAAKSYTPPYMLGEPMLGGAVGTVVESRDPGFPVGELVFHMAGWRDEAVLDAATPPTRLPRTGLPDQLWLSALGSTGGTAWFGLTTVAAARPGDIVFISAAAGAVGATAVQIAKARGMTVIGSAGGPAKVAAVRAMGADACIDYKAGNIEGQLRAAAPDGIDVYFDNVGGAHLDAALAVARDYARFAICGLIGGYNDAAPLRLDHAMRIVAARIRLEGFLFPDFADRIDAFHADMRRLIADGKVAVPETVRDGLEAMPGAFIGLFTGENIGKMLVRL